MMIPPPTPVPSVKNAMLLKLRTTADPKLAKGRRVGIIGKPNRLVTGRLQTIADRKLPPTGQIVGLQQHPLGNVHRARRRQPDGRDVARCKPQLLGHFAETLRRSPHRVVRSLFLLRRDTAIGTALTQIVHDPQFYIRAADVDAAKERALGRFDRDDSGFRHAQIDLQAGLTVSGAIAGHKEGNAGIVATI